MHREPSLIDFSDHSLELLLAELLALAALITEAVKEHSPDLASQPAQFIDRHFTRARHIDYIFQHMLRLAFSETLKPLCERSHNTFLSAEHALFLSPFVAGALKKQVAVLSDDPDRIPLRRLAEVFLQKATHAGAFLDTAKLSTLRTLTTEITSLRTNFALTVTQAMDTAEFRLSADKEPVLRMDGLAEGKLIFDESLLGRRVGPDGETELCFKMHPSIALRVLSYCSSEEVRRRFWREQRSLASENYATAHAILLRRHQIAQLFGLQSFNDYSCAAKMAGTSERMHSFLCALRETKQSIYSSDMATLAALKAQDHKDGRSLSEEIEPWDVLYYKTRAAKKQLSLDFNAVREYFVFSETVTRTLRFMEHVYGVSIRRIEDGLRAEHLWHPVVQLYSVWSAGESSEFLAHFYLDLCQRPGKQSGGWFQRLGSRAFAIIANFSQPPQQSSDEQHLMEFSELKTLFHEFGHLFHAILSDVPFISLEGIDVVWDFVEVPSTFNESFVYEPTLLRYMSAHWRSGAPLPTDVIGKVAESHTFLSSLRTFTTLENSFIDYFVHNDTYVRALGECRQEELQTSINQFLTQSLMGSNVLYHYPSAASYITVLPRFLHLFGDNHDYAAGYYSYLWSEAISSHMYDHVITKGGLVRDTGDDVAKFFEGVSSAFKPVRKSLVRVGNLTDAWSIFTEITGQHELTTVYLK